MPIDVALSTDRRDARHLGGDAVPQLLHRREILPVLGRSGVEPTADHGADGHERHRSGATSTGPEAHVRGEDRTRPSGTPGPMDVTEVLADLRAEQQALDDIVAGLDRRPVAAADAEPRLDRRRPDRPPHLLRPQRRATRSPIRPRSRTPCTPCSARAATAVIGGKYLTKAGKQRDKSGQGRPTSHNHELHIAHPFVAPCPKSSY